MSENSIYKWMRLVYNINGFQDKERPAFVWESHEKPEKY
jgi:hypothetical protein